MRRKFAGVEDGNRREFNFWWDPEAVLSCCGAVEEDYVTTVDISVKTRMTTR